MRFKISHKEFQYAYSNIDMFQVIKYNGNSMNNQTLDLCKYSRICLLISDILFHSKLSGLFQLEKIFFKITVMMYRINCGIKNIKLLFQHIELWTKCMIFFQQGLYFIIFVNNRFFYFIFHRSRSVFDIGPACSGASIPILLNNASTSFLFGI